MEFAVTAVVLAALLGYQRLVVTTLVELRISMVVGSPVLGRPSRFGLEHLHERADANHLRWRVRLRPVGQGAETQPRERCRRHSQAHLAEHGTTSGSTSWLRIISSEQVLASSKIAQQTVEETSTDEGLRITDRPQLWIHPRSSQTDPEVEKEVEAPRPTANKCAAVGTLYRGPNGVTNSLFTQPLSARIVVTLAFMAR
jgi:hypothetical protein